MPWRPSFDGSRDPQLDAFRERAGRLTDDEGSRGWVFVRPWVTARKVGGYLWWQRWSPQSEVSAGYVVMDDDDMPDDWVDQPEDVARELANWSTDRFRWRGVEYFVSWVTADESRRVRDDVFQLGEPET